MCMHMHYICARAHDCVHVCECVCVRVCVCVCVCVHADVSVNKRLDTVKLPKTTGVRGYCCLNQELNLQPLISSVLVTLRSTLPPRVCCMRFKVST